MTASQITEALLLDALREVIDPEIGCNIVDLGLVYSVAISGGAVTVAMTLTTPGCPMHEILCDGVRNVLLGVEGIFDVEVELVWDPPWNHAMMTDVGRAMTGARNF